jgi:Domain of unknown function (DUF4352)
VCRPLQIAHEVVREVIATRAGHPSRCTPNHRQTARGARTVSAMTQPPPPARGWHPDPSGTGSRYWDGRNWGPAAPPPAAAGGLPKKKQSVPTWVIVFAVIAVLGAIGEAGSHSNNSNSTSTSSSTATSAAIAAAPPATTNVPPPLAGIGHEVRDGKFAFVATSVDQSKTAGDPSNQVETVTAQGEFVNVHLTVSNVGDQPQSFFASNQKLQIGDKQPRRPSQRRQHRCAASIAARISESSTAASRSVVTTRTPPRVEVAHSGQPARRVGAAQVNQVR